MSQYDPQAGPQHPSQEGYRPIGYTVNGFEKPPYSESPYFQPAPPAPKKRHVGRNILLAIAGVITFFVLVGVIVGVTGGSGEQPAAPAAPPQTQPKAAPKAQPAQPHEATFKSVRQLERTVEGAGVTCNGVDWMQGPQVAGFDIEACGNTDGSAVVVAQTDASQATGDQLAAELKSEGTAAGDWGVSGETFFVEVPTKHDAKLVKAETGGTLTKL